MRLPQGVLLPPIAAARPRRGDLYRALRTAMLDGAISPGARLPSTRHAAADYGVSRGLVEQVFAQLTEEGFLERTIGRGTFVTRKLSRLVPPARSPKPRSAPAAVPAPSRFGRMLAASAACREPAVLRPFNAGVADTTEFPWKLWQRLSARAARELGRDALGFADPRGLPSLRAAIARYLAQLRGVRCTPGQVVIFNSTQQALNALAVLLLDRGDGVLLEDPCYPGARAAFALAGAEITPVPVDADGLRIDDAPRGPNHARLAYVTPSHQYPTGVALSLDRRIALLDWAARGGSWIIEDDYDGEFRYEGQPLAALHALDAQRRVIYLGTMNKSMFISLRLAYAVVPDALVEPLANLRTHLDGFTPAVQQMALALFMDEGHFTSHLRRSRAAYGARRTALVDALAPLAAHGWTWANNPAGFHLLINHDHGDHVRTIAGASRLDLGLLGTYCACARRDDGLFLRFGALDTATLRAGAATLVSEIRAARKKR